MDKKGEKIVNPKVPITSCVKFVLEEYAPYKAVRIPDYSCQEILASGIRILGLWNPYNSVPLTIAIQHWRSQAIFGLITLPLVINYELLR